MAEPTLTSHILMMLQTQEMHVHKTGDDCDLIEYSLPDGVKRHIKVNNQRNYVVVYTFDNSIVVNIEDRDNVLLYVTCINEGLSITGLELNLARRQYKYKSSQAFPKNVDPTGVISHFISLHDAHFPLLKRNINELQSTHKNPIECANEFIQAIRKT